MKTFISLLLLVFSIPVYAAQAVIMSDVWPAEAVQPTECVYIHSDNNPEITTEVVTPVEQLPEGRRCNMPINTDIGQHTFEIFAQNATSKSEKVLFTFTLVEPPTPTPPLTPPMNLQCSPNCTVP